jgi:hypothetical protein
MTRRFRRGCGTMGNSPPTGSLTRRSSYALDTVRTPLPLSLGRFADVFHGFAYLPLGVAKCILRLSGRLVRDPFIVKVRIVGRIARRIRDVSADSDVLVSQAERNCSMFLGPKDYRGLR